jgi:hypothetical protein
MQPASSNNISHLYIDILVGCSRPNTIRYLDSWNHSTHLLNFILETPFLQLSTALQLERFGNSSGTNYRLIHITYSNAFSFLCFSVYDHCYSIMVCILCVPSV